MVIPGEKLTIRNQISCRKDALEHNSRLSCILASRSCHQAYQLLHATRGHRQCSFGKRECLAIHAIEQQLTANKGVSATPHGALVTAKAGFEECEIIRLAQTTLQEKSAGDHAPHVPGIELWIGIRLPCSRSPSSGNSSQSESPT
jgi:hypothetical protein